MTANRFRCEFDRHYGYLFDDDYKTFYQLKDSESNIELLCERLNNLHEENQKCKEYNGILYANHTKTDRKLVKQISELEKENERLRRCINEIYTIARLEEVD